MSPSPWWQQTTSADSSSRNFDQRSTSTRSCRNDDGTIQSGRWALFPSDPKDMMTPPPPKLTPMHEDEVFKKFAELAKAVENACLHVSTITDTKRLCEFKCNPSRVPMCLSRHNTSRPDSYAILSCAKAVNDPTEKAQWVEVAVPGEFKKSDSSDASWDDRRKILWSMYHILRDDVRTEVFVSAPFDFIQDHRSVVEFLLCVAFAEEHQLGWDPTIKRLPPTPIHPSPRCEIIIKDTSQGEVIEKTYRTKDLIWNYGADALRGRGTRVWSVVEVDADGNEGMNLYVLKDSWVDVDSEREGRINRRINSCTVERGNTLDLQVFTKIFMQIQAFGDVYIGSRVDRTDSFKVDRSGEKLPAEGKFTVTVPTNVTCSTKPRQLVLHYPHKVHHRTVFKDVGRDLSEVDTLLKVYRLIGQVLLGLHVLHSANWVHRDISYGNILVIGRYAKIIDLEYVKDLSDPGAHHDVPTGTPYFMSEEVRTSRYNYDDPCATVQSTSLAGKSHDTMTEGLLQDPAATLPPVQTAQPEAGPNTVSNSALNEITDAALPHPDTTHPGGVIFRHNPLHDHESVLWLSLFVLLVSEYRNSELNEKGERKYDAQTFQGFMDAQHALAWKLFCEPDGLHPTVGKIICELSSMGSHLVDAFKDAEKDLKPGVVGPILTNWPTVNWQLGQNVLRIMSILKQTPLHLLTDITKRTRSFVRPKDVGNEEKRREDGDTANVNRESGTDEDQDGRPAKIRRVGRSKDASSSSRDSAATGSPFTYDAHCG
ncbi:uncharacterized protein PHACADRAFT_211889 [Phanerochaete carnosa HHB-10118-sp]|uniref:Protein kinase domain-containing protein n=1 Tax=Phanerochaete carnosa (strain HHB-10118-sp) TaxID=650164 RepID=K5WQM9_PHACS|nr:uncharacterized protein PHACADRAFT_211889 [Phanerochaete carnosa HHB-10118-sp]EKM52667.1 hypothetical protein PHACADRAFT_211889 [Phanerochaete carnosa HHB-10118-sp]